MDLLGLALLQNTFQRAVVVSVNDNESGVIRWLPVFGPLFLLRSLISTCLKNSRGLAGSGFHLQRENRGVTSQFLIE